MAKKGMRKKQKGGSGGVIKAGTEKEEKKVYPPCKWCDRTNHDSDQCHRGGPWSSDHFWSTAAGKKAANRLKEAGLDWWNWVPKQPKTNPPPELQQQQQQQQPPAVDKPKEMDRKHLDRLIRNQIGSICDEIREEEGELTQDACYHVIRRTTEALEQEIATDDFWNA